MKVGQAADSIGQIEVGKGLQQAIQPDGSIDRNVLAQVLKGSVAGSMQAPKALSALESLRNAGYSADAQGLQNFHTRMGLIGAATAHIIDDPSREGLMRGLGYLANPINGADKVGLGIPQIAEAAKQFYGKDGKPLPPAQLQQIAKQMSTQALASQEALRMHLPGSENVDNGQRITTMPTGSPMNPAIGRKVQKEIPPEATQPGENNQPTFRGTQPSSTGADYTMPGKGGVGDVIGYGSGGPTSGGRPVKLAQPGDGTAYGVPRGGAAGNAPGVSEAQQGAAAESTRQANALTAAMTEAPQTKSILNAMEEDLGKFASGPGADYTRIGKSFAIRNLPIPDSLKKEGGYLDPASIASQEQFNKFSTMFAQQQFKAMGGTGSDGMLNSASHTTPNEYLSSLGNKGIIQFSKGLQDAVQAKDKAWAKWQASGRGGPETFTSFSRDFNQNFDPRVFQFKYMSPDERQKTFSKMPEAERKQFAKDATRARLEGWVDYGAAK